MDVKDSVSGASVFYEAMLDFWDLWKELSPNALENGLEMDFQDVAH